MSVVKSISRILVGGAFVLTLAQGAVVQSAFAQDVSAGQVKAAKRMIAATGSTNRLDNILPQSAQALKNELIRNRPDQEAAITDVVDIVTLELAARRGDLENEVAQIFTKIFSEEEMGVIAAFYETEAGKKFLADGPLALREINGAAQVWTRGIRRDMGQKSSAKLKEMGLQ